MTVRKDVFLDAGHSSLADRQIYTQLTRNFITATELFGYDRAFDAACFMREHTNLLHHQHLDHVVFEVNVSNKFMFR